MSSSTSNSSKMAKLTEVFEKAIDVAIDSVGEKELEEIYGKEVTKTLDVQKSLIHVMRNSEEEMKNIFRNTCTEMNVEGIFSTSNSNDNDKPLLDVVQQIKIAETEKMNVASVALEKDVKNLKEALAKLKAQINQELDGMREECNKVSSAASAMET